MEALLRKVLFMHYFGLPRTESDKYFKVSAAKTNHDAMNTMLTNETRTVC